MRKYLLTCLILLLTMAAMAQQPKTTINLVESKQGVWIKLNGTDVFKVYQGTFRQKYSTLRSDSAYVYPQLNTFDAFGHVVITQGDTLHIYSDKLNYNDNTKIAILTDNVKMVDKDAILTTNNLNYNTATRYGTYVDGGKLVNKGNVLVSKNGYYFAQSRDAYFRYDVVMTSTDALIKTDTLRYNSGSRIAYFYGPTHIYGKKDKDTLYTENGTYNTQTEQAFFGKKNRYSQGTKSLKGDSLFYDKLKGYGKAVKNVTFDDNEQKMTIKGNLGEYYKSEDRAVITQNPYVIFVTEQKDTAKIQVDTAKKITVPEIKDKTGQALTTAKNTMPLVQNTKLPPTAGIAKKAANLKVDSLAKAIAAMPTVKNTIPLADKVKDTVKTTAQAKGLTPPKDKATSTGKNIKPNKNGKPVITDTLKNTPKDTIARIKRDTMYIGADTLETQIVTYKALKDLQEQRRLAGIRDTSIKIRKPFVPYKTIPKELVLDMPAFVPTPQTFIDRPLFAKPPVDSTQKAAVKTDLKDGAKKSAVDSLKAGVKDTGKKQTADNLKAAGIKTQTQAAATDSLKSKPDKLLPDSLKGKQAKTGKLPLKPVKPELSDTARVRILSAHHNVKIFKSDLQAKSDSLFYSSADSTIRSFVKPIYWTQGAQLSGDTIYMQLKNKKLDNMDVFPSAFIVYIEEADSVHFNQVGGKRLKGYFKDSKLSQMDVFGNAETIYFNRNKKKVVSEMQRSLSSSISLHMKNGETSTVSFRSKPDHKFYPIAKVKEDDKILKGFIWKPKERPANKEAVINPVKNLPPPTSRGPAKTGVPGKAPAKGAVVKPGAKGTAKPGTKTPVNPAAKDSVKNTPATTSPAGAMKKDSTIVPTKPPAKTLNQFKRDSTKAPAPNKPVSIKQDTVKKKPL